MHAHVLTRVHDRLPNKTGLCTRFGIMFTDENDAGVDMLAMDEDAREAFVRATATRFSIELYGGSRDGHAYEHYASIYGAFFVPTAHSRNNTCSHVALRAVNRCASVMTHPQAKRTGSQN